MVDLVITATSVLPGANSTTVDGTAGETLAAGKVVYLSPTTGKWMLADNNSATAEAKKPAGIALNGAAPNQPVRVQRSGEITIGATLTAGTAYYLSDTPGGICPVADVVTGENVVLIGLAKTTTILSVDIQTPGVTL